MKKRTKVKKGYKYRLHPLLRSLSVSDYEIAMRFFPSRLEVSADTFRAWIYIKIDESREIPGKALVLMSTFFEIEPKALFEEEIESISVSDLREFNKFKNVEQIN